MTPLRQRMLEDMQVRNLSPRTRTTYLQHVARFARHFQQSPDCLGPAEMRAYQLYLTNDRKLAVASRLVTVAALRFLFTVTLRKPWRVEDVLPAPQKPDRLPVVLSPDEVLRFLDGVPGLKHRAIDHLLRGWVTHLRSPPSPSHGHRQPPHGDSCRGREGPRRTAT